MRHGTRFSVALRDGCYADKALATARQDGEGPVAAGAWTEISVAAGTKGPCVFDWTASRINHPHSPAWQRFLLLRRSRSKAGEITAYPVFGPTDTSLEKIARVAGQHWAIDESFV